jgi:hypothetical protein
MAGKLPSGIAYARENGPGSANDMLQNAVNIWINQRCYTRRNREIKNIALTVLS